MADIKVGSTTTNYALEQSIFNVTGINWNVLKFVSTHNNSVYTNNVLSPNNGSWSQLFCEFGASYRGDDIGAWNTLSDRRLKENIVDIDDGLSKIMALKPVCFNWRRPEAHCGRKEAHGFIAQDFQKIFPQLVSTMEPKESEKDLIDDGQCLTIAADIIPFLVQAIQQLSKEVLELKKSLKIKE